MLVPENNIDECEQILKGVWMIFEIRDKLY